MIVLYQGNGGITDVGALASLYSRLFDQIKVKRSNMPREGAQFFSERTTHLKNYTEGEASLLLEVPERNEDTDRIPLFTPIDGFNQSWVNVRRRAGVIVTRDAVESQKTRLITRLWTGLPKSQMSLEQFSYATLLNNGFASETTGDGSFVFATDHQHEDAQHGTWSNVAAAGSGFTTASYLAAWQSLQQRKNEKGFPEPQLPTQVVYPIAIHEDVMKVRGSDKYPQNDLNAKLPELFGAFEPVPRHWGISNTAWFVRGSKADEDQGFLIVWQTRPNFAPISDGMNPDIIMGRRLRSSFSVGALHSRNWYGNAGP